MDDSEYARLMISPGMAGGLPLGELLAKYCKDLDPTFLISELNKQLKEVSEDDNMERCQQILAAQAITLNAVFSNYLQKAVIQTSRTHSEQLLKLALKAQSQSRCTMETISKIKNPPNATFVKQQNVAHGHQQVNNHVATPSDSSAADRADAHEEKPVNTQNELLENQYEQRLDTRTSSEAIRANQELETVGAVNRRQNG